MAHSSVSTHEPEASRGQHQFSPSIKQLDPLASLLPPEKQINHTVLRLTSGSNTYFLPLDGDDSLWSIARNLHIRWYGDWWHENNPPSINAPGPFSTSQICKVLCKPVIMTTRLWKMQLPTLCPSVLALFASALASHAFSYQCILFCIKHSCHVPPV